MNDSTLAFLTDPTPHPGGLLAEALRERGMTQADLARRLGVSAKHVWEITVGRSGYSAEVALGLERELGISARLWVRMLADYELAEARQRSV